MLRLRRELARAVIVSSCSEAIFVDATDSEGSPPPTGALAPPMSRSERPGALTHQDVASRRVHEPILACRSRHHAASRYLHTSMDRSTDEIRRHRFPRHQPRARHGARAASLCRAASPRWSGTPTRRCRPAPTSSSCPAASPTATICAAARSRRARRSWTRCARMPARGGLVLGVCNGFQILCESGLLPGVLMRNAELRFICKDVLSAGRALRHAVHPRLQRRPGDPRAGRAWRGQLRRRRRDRRAARRRGPRAFRYAAPDGKLDPSWNINGATNAIAGILNERGNVLGLMPHPENHVEGVDRLRPTAAACSPA